MLGKQQAIFRGEITISLIGSFIFMGIWFRAIAVSVLRFSVRLLAIWKAKQTPLHLHLHKPMLYYSPLQALPAITRLPYPGIGGNEQINPEHASGGSVTLHSSQ